MVKMARLYLINREQTDEQSKETNENKTTFVCISTFTYLASAINVRREP